MQNKNELISKTSKKILSGKDVAEHCLLKLKKKIDYCKSNGITPCLKVILVGANPASEIYTRNKKRKCHLLGMDGKVITFPDSINTKELCMYIHTLNNDTKVHGILIQLPLPSHIDVQKVLNTVSPEKDVDGFHTVNVGRLQKMLPNTLIPCTAKGIWEILKFYNIEIKGSNVVIIGRSEIVGKPIAALLSAKHKYGNATVTICHSATKDISSHTQRADIIVAAIGKPRFITADMIKENVIIIDVGINRVKNTDNNKTPYKIVGDVDFEGVLQKARAITPVPGGVGPMTIAMLMYNTVQITLNACKNK